MSEDDKELKEWTFASMVKHPKECFISLLVVAIITLYGANLWANSRTQEVQEKSFERIVTMQKENTEVQTQNVRIQTEQTEVLRGIKDEIKANSEKIGDHTRRIEVIETKIGQ